ncbi:HAD family hydrolase [Thalassomonas actiniarum]|uniref:HAD family hydrolase n=1 Tax=Thalassomonas actiniarum TaxID=485447 RepID=A0AAE9YUT5_9GAMM|nr:HAD family hydrolase [Thalassomonas actiniarum]WDE00967.1 HAD family hydrolase [Thalassomonas actiniarum]
MDIDETLLHASTYPLAQAYDYKAERTWIYKRPYVDELLQYCAQFFRLAVWTSARASYAGEIFSQVFPYLTPEFIYSEKHCLTGTAPDGSEHSLKPLGILEQQGFDLRRVLMVDDSPEKLALNPGNLILIEPFYPKIISGHDDIELKKLKNYLALIRNTEDFLSIKKSLNLTDNRQRVV